MSRNVRSSPLGFSRANDEQERLVSRVFADDEVRFDAAPGSANAFCVS
jgi:hypothetical protein